MGRESGLAGNSQSPSRKRINALSLELTLCNPCEIIIIKKKTFNPPPSSISYVPPALDVDVFSSSGLGLGAREKANKKNSVLKCYLAATFGWGHGNPPEC